MVRPNVKLLTLFLFILLQKGVKQIPSYKFLPLMYQLAARMGTKMATGPGEDTCFNGVLHDVILCINSQQQTFLQSRAMFLFHCFFYLLYLRI